jgi:hypothetical protein
MRSRIDVSGIGTDIQSNDTNDIDDGKNRYQCIFWIFQNLAHNSFYKQKQVNK